MTNSNRQNPNPQIHGLSNPRDPLAGNIADPGMILFKQCSGIAANGMFPASAVIDAGFNMILNAVRQSFPLRKKAMERLDQLHVQMKEQLARQYGHTGNRLQGLYPYDQVIEMMPADFRTEAKFYQGGAIETPNPDANKDKERK